MTTALAGDGDGGGASSPPQASASASKGKAKMDDETAAEAWTCGICLAKPREPIRGELDCCAHHFCFVCIMGWARVESRCPFCKARFRTIRRPPVPGLLPSERIVAVPERNQVYRPEGNASSTMGVDPYANTICSVCNCGENDELLILCDLCDSAAHSYCAGLGTVVPEEDWFCDDCAVCKEHSRCQVEDEDTNLGSGTTVQSSRVSGSRTPVQSSRVSGSRTPVQSSRVSMDYPVPSIYDIVGDDYTTDAGSIRLPSNSENAGSQSPKSTREQDNGLASYHALIRKEIEKNRAFRNSRNRDKRIRALRESWASLREGSLGFGTHVPCRRTQGEGETTSGIPEYQRFAAPTVDCSKNGVSGPSGSSDLLSLAPFSEEASTSLSHGNKISHKDTRDVRKAWKMLQMAKSSGERKASRKLSSLNSSSPFSMGNRSTSYSPIDTILGLKNQNLNKATQKNSAKCDHGTKMDSAPTTENSRKCRSLPGSSRSSAHERDISFHDQINEESLNGEVAASKNHHFVGKKLEPLCGTDRSEKVKSDTPRPVKCSLSSGQSTVTSSLQVGPSAGSQSNVMVNPEDSSAVCVATTDENRSSATIEVRKCSGSDHHERKRKLSSEKRHDQTSKRSRSSCKSAKTEISSLAIRELKLLKIDKTYGSDRFKEVARTVTHTVLAACEFEHSPSQSLAISKPVCEHSSAVKPSKSSVIADSCAECLRDFVKEAIGLVLSGSQMDKTVQT